jgi:hypothetical protein
MPKVSLFSLFLHLIFSQAGEQMVKNAVIMNVPKAVSCGLDSDPLIIPVGTVMFSRL